MRSLRIALALAAGVSLASAAPAPCAHAHAADPLVGSWDTGPVPTARLRRVLHAKGYTTPEIAKFYRTLQIGRVEEINLIFYRDRGRPYQIQRGWNPTESTKPSDGDHGPYRFLSKHRFVVSGVDPPTNRIHYTYSYRVHSGQLKLRFLSLREPFPKRRVRLDRMFGLFTALFTYKRIS